MEEKKDKKDPEAKKPAKNAVDLQKLKLDKLFRNIDKPVHLPEAQGVRPFSAPPEFVRNVMGSSAGAGSGEFHVYRHIRRREYARQKYISEQAARDEKDVEYQRKLEQNRLQTEARTEKRRAKRQKKKARQKDRPKRQKREAEATKAASESSDDPESEAEEDAPAVADGGAGAAAAAEDGRGEAAAVEMDGSGEAVSAEKDDSSETAVAEKDDSSEVAAARPETGEMVQAVEGSVAGSDARQRDVPTPEAVAGDVPHLPESADPAPPNDNKDR